VRLHHLALRADDPDRTAAYYRAVLGLPERARQLDAEGALRAVWLEADGVVLMIERRAPGEPLIPPGAMELVAFTVPSDQLESWRARLAPIEAETANTLYTRDPDGRRVAVSRYPFDFVATKSS
jgi:catechol 2,3-dioxygenase-like lactoylglutathione lyase family enzyme